MAVVPAGLSKKARAFLIDGLLNGVPADNEDDEEKQSLMTDVSTTPDIRCDLARPELWQQFSQIGTEMIITKAGRRMFPSMQVQFSGDGINPLAAYLVIFEIVPASGKRFRYSYLQSSWTTLDVNAASSSSGGKGERAGNYFSRRATASDFSRETCGTKFYVHPECPISGQQLVDKMFSFERIKLTNNEAFGHLNDHVVLKSMHQYEPRVHLVELTVDNGVQQRQMEASADSAAPFSVGNKVVPPANTVWTFNFPEARFMAVTAYQNQLITKLKIDNNPFAKGFRKLSRFSVAQVHLALGSSVGAGAGGGTSQAIIDETSKASVRQSSRPSNNNNSSSQNRRPNRRAAYWEKFH